MNRKFKLSLYIAAIFAAGVITGIFISYQVVRHMMPNQERMAKHWCGELESKLDLKQEQMQKIRPIIDKALVGFKKNLSQEIFTSLSNAYEKIALELTPEQKVKLEKLHHDQENFLRSKLGTEPAGKQM
jgi:hypothetical protein